MSGTGNAFLQLRAVIAIRLAALHRQRGIDAPLSLCPGLPGSGTGEAWEFPLYG